MRPVVVLASLVLACGDNLVPPGPGLAQTAELVVVAHPADDLILMQPDLLDAVQSGRGLTALYLHADAVRPDAGTVAAYMHVSADEWHCGAITIETQLAQHCRSEVNNISLIFVGRPELATLVRLIRVTNPSTVRTLEITGTHGEDDPEHLEAGALTVRALAVANRTTELIAYRGDGIAAEPPNKLTPVFDASVEMLARYEACATGCARCGDACTAIDQEHVDLLLRRYAIGFRRVGGGRLRIGNECLAQDMSMTSCLTAPSWILDGSGELRTGDSCIAVGADNQPTTSPCVGGKDRRWFIDDEGHILTAAGELRCLTPGTGLVHLESCGPTNNPTWEIVPDTQLTTRATLGITATGRDVRLGDVTGDGWADLCAIENAMLMCAEGKGIGQFRPAIRIDAASSPLAIDPRSLVLGDVDGDLRADACGRDAGGILCATVASGFHAARWSQAFDDASARATTAASLAAIDSDGDGIAELCGLDSQGVICASAAGIPAILRTAWPASDAIVWSADLDGDRQADWCAATDTGPACAVWADSALTTDGAPWGYAHGGIVDVAPATYATVALADIDGDRRADLCSLRDDRIVCSRSQGGAFGPRTTLAILPNQTTASALWLGDLDGDGRADPCVDTGPAIVCARQP